MGKWRNNQRGKKALTHQRQKQRGHRVKGELGRGLRAAASERNWELH